MVDGDRLAWNVSRILRIFRVSFHKMRYASFQIQVDANKWPFRHNINSLQRAKVEMNDAPSVQLPLYHDTASIHLPMYLNRWRAHLRLCARGLQLAHVAGNIIHLHFSFVRRFFFFFFFSSTFELIVARLQRQQCK